MKVDFCFPVYNEELILEKNVSIFIDHMRRKGGDIDWELNIVVNGSGDNSLEAARRLKKKHPKRVDCYEISESGKGRALKTHLSQSRAEAVVYMDIDLAVSLDNIDDVLRPVRDEGYDLVLGSRLLPGSRTDRSFVRTLSSRGYNLLSRLLLGHSFKDLQCGFKAVRVSGFRDIYPFLEADKWFFDTEMITWGKELGLRIKEVPVDWSEERYDKRKSKINIIKDGIVFFQNLLRLRKRMKEYRNKNRKKVPESIDR